MGGDSMTDSAPLSPSHSAPVVIRQASTAEEFAAARDLFQEYAASLRISLCFQGFGHELTVLDSMYAPPEGCLLIAYVSEKPAGCGALRRMTEHVGELKRMYVRPEYRGCGIGRRMATALLAQARALHYSTVRLDTLASMSEARALYHSLGFRPCRAYYSNPLPDVIYMERPLDEGSGGRV
jgi:putative acetyltransferase